MTTSWRDAAARKREATSALIPVEWRVENLPSVKEQVDVTDYIKQYLSEEELEITESDADQIVEKTTSGAWTAEKVTRAFCHRAALAHQLLNCLHEIFFDAAIDDAKKLDAYFAEYKRPAGPLHGLPISLKDQFHVKDVETTMGYVGWIGTFEGKKGTGKEKVYESEMVRELRASGAVLYCKTSVPHTLMSGETVNNIIGYTLNPKNRNLSSGGSSGGEGALVGIRGSPVGFGTDIGGSIRIPAAFNGLYGLRPSTGRLPYHGMSNSMDGQNTVLSVVGPLGTTAASLRLVTKALLSQQPWLHDPMVHEIPWRSEEEESVQQLLQFVGEAVPKEKKLSFGILHTDGVVSPTAPIHRAIEIVSKALKSAGHEVVAWAPPSHKVLNDAGFRSWVFDGGRDVREAFALSGEPMAPQVSLYQNEMKEFTATEIAETNVRMRELKKEYMEYWNSTAKETSTGRPVDAVISPLAPWPAARREKYKYYGYSTWINALDYTTVAFPVTNVDKSVDVKSSDFKPLDNQDQEIQDDYDPEIYDGAHVSLQVVGRRLQEEKILAIAEYLGKLIGK
ncbi:amidase signature domain-containing protein [Boeremia exigua]|uniref:amidase signature domain-containing protein n=1 Tax=Boeremia exigua TaxID=749465 RepID=UPI001E8CDDCE|nr:amidase signature domain-containing protein [Boeremia exigua]KAH6629263.1 amidase signature domain-containing protein [Boeremia exigua]